MNTEVSPHPVLVGTLPLGKAEAPELKRSLHGHQVWSCHTGSHLSLLTRTLSQTAHSNLVETQTLLGTAQDPGLTTRAVQLCSLGQGLPGGTLGLLHQCSGHWLTTLGSRWPSSPQRTKMLDRCQSTLMPRARSESEGPPVRQKCEFLTPRPQSRQDNSQQAALSPDPPSTSLLPSPWALYTCRCPRHWFRHAGTHSPQILTEDLEYHSLEPRTSPYEIPALPDH